VPEPEDDEPPLDEPLPPLDDPLPPPLDEPLPLDEPPLDEPPLDDPPLGALPLEPPLDAPVPVDPVPAVVLGVAAAGVLDAAPSGELAVPVPASFLSPPLSGFADEYRSLYQPLPLNWNAVREISRSSASLPHASQVTLSSSTMRCWYSNSRAHALHRYS
jgi:hypothetical protein